MRIERRNRGGEGGERETSDRKWREKEREKMERERDPNSEKPIRKHW